MYRGYMGRDSDRGVGCRKWYFPVNCRGVQGLSQQGVRVSFWHPGPRKIPTCGGKGTLSFGQNFL